MDKPASVDHPILPLIQNRWSPVAFDPEPLSRETVLSLFEAARWAASCFNEQPWRYVVGAKGHDDGVWQGVLDTLVPANQAWAQHAPLLCLGVARQTFTRNDKPNRHAGYDVGQATTTLVLQAASMGLVAHQMAGFDPAAARERFAIPEGFEPMAVTAVGRPGSGEALDEKTRSRDEGPRGRRPLGELLVGEAWGTPPGLLA
ncbi:MAG: nitroreductase family protein [Planctomycetota bacterium]|nr:nitroreductase family protein [Planctomycetota bacterium]